MTHHCSKFEQYQNMEWIDMNIKELDFEDGTKDCVIDKACFDSMACGLDAPVETAKMLDQIYRVLSPTGIYISISNRPPDSRKKYFEKTK